MPVMLNRMRFNCMYENGWIGRYEINEETLLQKEKGLRRKRE
jgi:hypothetical protein